MAINTAAQKYRSVYNTSAVTDASPHQLISLLFTGVLDNLSAAKGAIEQGNVPLKGEKIGRAIEIVDNLRAVLNTDVGGEVADNLAALYEYMESRLLTANINSDEAIVDEVAMLMTEIKLGWDAIPEEERLHSAANSE